MTIVESPPTIKKPEEDETPPPTPGWFEKLLKEPKIKHPESPMAPKLGRNMWDPNIETTLPYSDGDTD